MIGTERVEGGERGEGLGEEAGEEVGEDVGEEDQEEDKGGEGRRRIGEDFSFLFIMGGEREKGEEKEERRREVRGDQATSFLKCWGFSRQ